MDNLSYIKAMIVKYHRDSEGTENYKIKKVGKYTVIYLVTDDWYCPAAEMWFDKTGKFCGFYDPEI